MSKKWEQGDSLSKAEMEKAMEHSGGTLEHLAKVPVVEWDKSGRDVGDVEKGGERYGR